MIVAAPALNGAPGTRPTSWKGETASDQPAHPAVSRTAPTQRRGRRRLGDHRARAWHEREGEGAESEEEERDRQSVGAGSEHLGHRDVPALGYGPGPGEHPGRQPQRSRPGGGHEQTRSEPAVPPNRIALLIDSVEVLADSPAKLEHAKACTELGAALRRANRRSEAREQLRRAVELATICGATPLAARAETELLATGARPGASPCPGLRR
jgi:hypothetical protein